MRYLALATDYDGTLAHHGVVADSQLADLDRLRATGRKVILVTGRELADLRTTFAHFEKFDRVVAENGAIVLDPATGVERLLTEPPPPRFIEDLQRRGVPIAVGRTIVATVVPHEAAVLASIRDLGLEWHVIFNKGAVMALPSGVNKATGLVPVLNELGIAPERVAAIGDAENDHAFLTLCGFAVAVANALPALKERADYITAGQAGDGVRELIDMMLKDDLKGLGRAVELP